MPQATRSLDPSLSPRHRFGAELRRWRQLRGLSQAGLARLIHVSPDLVAKIEKADRRPNRSLAETCDRLLGADGSLAAKWLEIKPDEPKGATSPIDPELAAHWSRMLTMLAATDNAIGVRGLQGIIIEELCLLDRTRRGTAGPCVDDSTGYTRDGWSSAVGSRTTAGTRPVRPTGWPTLRIWRRKLMMRSWSATS
jgi:transcriptional regulator with XRE-family HTH domain